MLMQAPSFRELPEGPCFSCFLSQCTIGTHGNGPLYQETEGGGRADKWREIWRNLLPHWAVR